VFPCVHACVRVHARAWMLVCGTPHHHRRFAWIPLIDWANPDNSSFFSANALAMQADDGATLCVAQHTPFAISRSLCERFNQFAIDSVCGRCFTHVFTRSLVSEFPIHSRLLYFYSPRTLQLSSCSLPILFSLLLPTFSLLSSYSTALSFTRATSSPARYKLK
jgi:hypothetical protein